MPLTYEFHAPETGWLPAQPIPVDHPEAAGTMPRDGTVHLEALLPTGRHIYRQHVASESHRMELNILSGRCRLCGLREIDHHAPEMPEFNPRSEEAPRCLTCKQFVYLHRPGALGRVYRVSGRADEDRETETAEQLPTPRTLEQVKAQNARTVRA